MTLISISNSNYESKNRFMWYLPAFAKWFTHKEGEIKDLLKEYKDHLAKARLERNYYNKNTKLAIEQRKLIDQNYLLINSNTKYCSIDAIAHYSYNWAQNVHVPHSD